MCDFEHTLEPRGLRYKWPISDYCSGLVWLQFKAFLEVLWNKSFFQKKMQVQLARLNEGQAIEKVSYKFIFMVLV